MIGAEAALLLLEEMKSMPDASGVSPDIVTYTTVISGVARAEVSLNSQQLNTRVPWTRRLGSTSTHAQTVLRLHKLLMDAVKNGHTLFPLRTYCRSII